MENRELTDYAICEECNHPNLIWQPWRNVFRCGWCEKDYTKKQVEKLKRLSESACRRRQALRAGTIAATGR